MTTERLYLVNGEQLTRAKLEERNKLIGLLRPWMKRTHGCCGAYSESNRQLVQARFAQLYEWERMMLKDATKQ